MSAFGSPAPKFELYFAAVDKQTGAVVTIASVNAHRKPHARRASLLLVIGPPENGYSVLSLVGQRQTRHVHRQLLLSISETPGRSVPVRVRMNGMLQRACLSLSFLAQKQRY